MAKKYYALILLFWFQSSYMMDSATSHHGKRDSNDERELWAIWCFMSGLTVREQQELPASSRLKQELLEGRDTVSHQSNTTSAALKDHE